MRTTEAGLPVPARLPVSPGGARRQLRSFLDECGWCGDVDAVMLAVHEAMINAAYHGGGVVRAEASIENGSLTVLIWDRGPGFDIPDTSRAGSATIDPLAEDGRGLWLICQIASWAEARREGDDFCLHLRFDARRDRGCR